MRVALAIVGLGAALAAPVGAGLLVNNPTPDVGPAWAPVLDNRTTFSRHETVTEWHLGSALGTKTALEAKWLGAQIIVPNFGGRVRYFSNEGEVEAKAALLRAGARRSLRVAASAFASRYWLDTQDGAGARRKLIRGFYGPKLVAEYDLGVFRPSLTLKAMRVVERGRQEQTVAAAGLGLRADLASRPRGRLEAVGEWNPFLRNPLDYAQAWGAGLRWHAGEALAMGLFVTNTFGGLSPDSFFGTRFPQYRFQWSFTFQGGMIK